LRGTVHMDAGNVKQKDNCESYSKNNSLKKRKVRECEVLYMKGEKISQKEESVRKALIRIVN